MQTVALPDFLTSSSAAASAGRFVKAKRPVASVRVVSSCGARRIPRPCCCDGVADLQQIDADGSVWNGPAALIHHDAGQRLGLAQRDIGCSILAHVPGGKTDGQTLLFGHDGAHTDCSRSPAGTAKRNDPSALTVTSAAIAISDE